MKTPRFLSFVLAALISLPGCGQQMSDPDDNNIEGPEDPEPPPANWDELNTSGAPTWLGIYVNDSASNAGTTHTLKLAYRNKTATYSCTINGASKGETKGCTPSQSSTQTNNNEDQFYLSFADSSASSDGLRFSSVKVTLSGVTYTKDEFDRTEDGENNIECHGCGSGGIENCGSCWIDGNSSGGANCVEVRIPMDNDPTDSSIFTNDSERTACIKKL
jgi:hypothetical protein